MSDVYTLEDAIQSIKASKKRNFNESLDAVFKLRGANIKDNVSLAGSIKSPHPLQKKLVIAVFTDTQVDGADYVGGEDLIAKFKKDKSLARTCSVCIAKPEYMKKVSSELGKLLGRRRLIPDAKMGTVSANVQQIVEDFRRGVMTFRANKNLVHVSFGKISDSDADLIENFNAVVRSINDLLPANSSITDAHISSTMGGSKQIILQKGKV